MKIINLIQQSKEWHDFRANGVGASDIASICEIEGAFKKRREVLLEKLGFQKEISDYQAHLFAEGNAWEIEVRDKINQDGQFDFQPRVIARTDQPRFFASLDGYDEKTGVILEIKYVKNKETLDRYVKQVPPHYMTQVQWQMYVSGTSNTALIAFVHDGHVEAVKVTSNPSEVERYVLAAREFLATLDDIKTGKLPSPVQNINVDETHDLVTLLTQEEILSDKLDEVKARIKEYSTNLLKKYQATQLENDRVTITLIDKIGSVNYKNVPVIKALDENYLNQFRGKGTKYPVTKLKK